MKPSSRLWIYQADRFLSDEELEKVRQASDQFLTTWLAHGRELFAEIELFYGLFLILAVDESQAKASGCSIDSSVQFIQDLEKKLNCSFMNRNLLTYRSEEGIQILDRAEFRKALESNKITESTIVFNNLIQSLSEFKNWETELRNSWHYNAFFNPVS